MIQWLNHKKSVFLSSNSFLVVFPVPSVPFVFERLTKTRHGGDDTNVMMNHDETKFGGFFLSRESRIRYETKYAPKSCPSLANV